MRASQLQGRPEGTEGSSWAMDIDVTYLIQLGIFLFALVTLNSLILQPFLRVIEKREEMIEGAKRDVEILRKQGDADMEKYQARMRDAGRDAHRAREDLRDEGRDEERKLLAEVRAQIADKLNAARQEVGDAESKARAELSTETDEMVREIVGKILDQEVAA